MTSTETDIRDTAIAWKRLAVGLAVGTIGSVGMWSFVVALPAVQKDFGIARGEASLPYTLSMVGFAFGGVALGRLADRVGIFTPMLIGAVLLAVGYVSAAFTPNIVIFAFAQLVLGVGTSASFAPLMADVSHWFVKRRGIAVAVGSAGNYMAGTLWPPLIQRSIDAWGWRTTHLAIGIICIVTIIPLAMMMRRRAPHDATRNAQPDARFGALGIQPTTLLALLAVAGVACCVAMAMPQVHIVAYCADLGYGAARGAEMLSVMLGLGIVSRLISGIVADKIGGVRTLLMGSFLQGVALFLYMFFDGLASLYVISGLFGLFQGGIVPMYAVIIREYFPASKAGSYVGIVVMATLFGMALGGWMSGAIFDLTGSYRMAFLNGLAWNLLNVAICVFLLWRRERSRRDAEMVAA